MKVVWLALLACACCLFAAPACWGQDTVTGAFEGTVTNSQTGNVLAGATVELINVETNLAIVRKTDVRGRFFQGLLAPGLYRIRVSLPGYQTQEVVQRLLIARTGEVVPVPVSLDPLPSSPLVTTPTTPTTPTAPIAPTATPRPAPTAPGTATASANANATTNVRAALNTTDASRGASFHEAEISLYPLGSATLTRSFDELALLLPGVAAPPQTLGSVAGPGQGAGVGTAGQFAVNGLRSRANNFTVDGSDNNDEDIGVRRQGFTALVPQPIESIREYQATTLLAPAQFGRNFGANVNAVSKSGGNEHHGALYGFFNASQLNARNRFDFVRSETAEPVVGANGQTVTLDARPVLASNNAGREDSFTLGKVGAILGGPLRRQSTFYFLSFEGQKINAVREENFAVPTIEERGAFGTGATGIFQNPFDGRPLQAYPTSFTGDQIFSLFPFPNHPKGIYGRNTFTRALPASARGAIFSGKLEQQFKWRERLQTLTGRYNFTDDWRAIPATGGAIFSTLKPYTRAQNVSLYLNSQLSGDGAARAVFNQIRVSYGRTRLRFDEVLDREMQLASDQFPMTPFLLNRPLLGNSTLPGAPGQPNRGAVIYERLLDSATRRPLNTEALTGPLGQVHIAGFSPLGVDVYNFPQRRVNNTYQIADILTVRSGDHSLAFGTDNRRTELNSALPRVFRPLVTYQGTPRLDFLNGRFQTPADSAPLRFIRPEDLASTGAASNFFLTLVNGTSDANINLRFYQLNFFAQDVWHVRPALTLSYGLRYEYNTTVREANRLIEQTFSNPALSLVPGLNQFVAGRQEIFKPEKTNFAPRLSLAYAPQWFGRERTSVLRAGVGVFYDQLLGAVVSQSRNVFPTFLTLNFGGLLAQNTDQVLSYINPSGLLIGNTRLTAPGTLNQLNPQLLLNQQLISELTRSFPNAFGTTLPTPRLQTPSALHYSFAYEQQLNRNHLLSLSYVGTQGRHLLRFTTPNFGPATNIIPTRFAVESGLPLLSGRICSPTTSSRDFCTGGRPVNGVGAVNVFETSANSSYNSLQLAVRGRWAAGLQYQAAYVWSSARDDVSDVFDLAGAYNLPQNSLNLAAERGPANFDVRQRATYALIYDVPTRTGAWRWLTNDWQFTSLARFHTGQPFTVNSIFDMNLDGNLTDRLNSTAGLLATRDGRQPIIVRTDNLTGLLARPGQDGRLGRNSFRAGGLAEVDLAMLKLIRLSAARQLRLRADVFNLFNQANYGIPVRLLEAAGFGQAVSTVTPGLRLQLGMKLEF